MPYVICRKILGVETLYYYYNKALTIPEIIVEDWTSKIETAQKFNTLGEAVSRSATLWEQNNFITWIEQKQTP